MEKNSNGGSIKNRLKQTGYSLIELMVTLVICSILMAILSQNFGGLQRGVQRFIENTTYREQYLIFLLKFEEDYHRSDAFNDGDFSSFDQLGFTFDLNGDGDHLDSGENVAYRWNEKKKRIDRKSGKGSYQAFLDGVESLIWTRTSNFPLCYRLTISSVFSQTASVLDLCRDT